MVNVQVFPSSKVDISPPVAPKFQLPECLKFGFAALKTIEMSCQPSVTKLVLMRIIFSRTGQEGRTMCGSRGTRTGSTLYRDIEDVPLLSLTCRRLVSCFNQNLSSLC